MKILVTGATGNVGNYVLDKLIKMNEQIVGASPDSEKLKEKYNDKVEARYLDFENVDSFDDVLEDVDRVFLMRPPHLGKPEDLYLFIEKMKNCGIELVVFLSLMGIEKNTIPPHYKIERKIEEVGLNYCHIRPGFFMQNLSGIHSEEIKKYDYIFVPAGKSKTSFIDAEDIGFAIAKVLHESEQHKNTSYTLTGPESLDYFQVAKILSEVLKREITYNRPGYLKYRRFYIKKRKIDKTYVNVTVALYFMTRMGTAKKITNTFESVTGKKPTTFLEFAHKNQSVWI